MGQWEKSFGYRASSSLRHLYEKHPELRGAFRLGLLGREVSVIRRVGADHRRSYSALGFHLHGCG